MIKIKILTEKKKKKVDRCAARAKREFDVYPSYNAASAIARCRRGEIWKKGKKESVNEVEISATKNKIAKHNHNFLLHSQFEVNSKSDPDILDNMIEDLYNAEFERSGDFDILDSDEVEHQALADSLINGVPSLKKWKIVSAITGASFGKIFKLNNNHILKLFVGGINPNEDMDWYKKCYDLLHSGGAKATTLPVYEYGQIKINNKFPVWYVEMAEVEPLDKFLKLTGRSVGGDDRDSEGKNAVSKLEAYFQQAYNKNITDLEGIKDYVARQFRIFDTPGLYPKADDDSEEGFDYGGEMYRPLTEAEAFGILEAFFDMVKMGFPLSDVAPRNLGVLKQSSPSNPKIVIFDR